LFVVVYNELENLNLSLKRGMKMNPDVSHPVDLLFLLKCSVCCSLFCGRCNSLRGACCADCVCFSVRCVVEGLIWVSICDQSFTQCC